MKKVLSVLLAAAMVMGMSVTSFAADDDAGYIVYGSGSGVNPIEVNTINFGAAFVFDENGNFKKRYDANDVKTANIDEGDAIYFALVKDGNLLTVADSEWKIKAKGDSDYLRDVKFVTVKNTAAKTTELADKLNANMTAQIAAEASAVFVRARIKDDAAVLDEDTDFSFYILDTDNGVKSEKVKMYLNFIETDEKTLYEDNLDWEIEVGSHVTEYTYHEDEKAAYATINFDDVAYGEFKMYPDEDYKLAVDVDYNKALSQEWDTDVEVIELTMTNAGNTDLVLLAEEDEYQVVAVVDGELVPVEATFVEDHEFESGVEATGYLVENAEYTAYAVIDATVEIEVETEVEAPVEADKANPETGAADFVGAAVAMAVVSVAAAGALALKK